MNKKIVILGANGQVASEIILEIKRQSPTANIVGVCRSEAGSVFLRYNKVSVVHASLESDVFPTELLHDADIVVNTIFIRGQPAEIKNRYEKLLKKIFLSAGKQTKIIHFSTVSVFHDGIYALEKRHQEKTLEGLAKEFNKKLILLRLGHVFGRNQGYSVICADVAKRIRGKIQLPNTCMTDANCVSIKYLSKIILDIAEKDFDRHDIDTYTAVFNPVVTWADILKYFGVTNIDCVISQSNDGASLMGALLNDSFARIRRNKYIHDFAMSLVRLIPSFEQKIYARHLLSRAHEDMAAMLNSREVFSKEIPYILWAPAPGKRYPLDYQISKEDLFP